MPVAVSLRCQINPPINSEFITHSKTRTMTDPIRQHLQSLEFDVPADPEPHPIPDSDLPDDDGIDHDAPSTEFDLDFDFSE